MLGGAGFTKEGFFIFDNAVPALTAVLNLQDVYFRPVDRDRFFDFFKAIIIEINIYNNKIQQQNGD